MIKAGGAYAKRVAISHSASIGCQSVPCCQSEFFKNILGTLTRGHVFTAVLYSLLGRNLSMISIEALGNSSSP